MIPSPIGSLNRRLTLEAPLETPDGGGGATVSWQPVADVWAAVRPVTGSESLRDDAVASRVSHRIAIRYRPDVTAAMRLREAVRVFEIEAVLDGGPRQRLVLLCTETAA